MRAPRGIDAAIDFVSMSGSRGAKTVHAATELVGKARNDNVSMLDRRRAALSGRCERA